MVQVKNISLHTQIYFRSLPFVFFRRGFNAKKDFNLNDLIEMTDDAFKFFFNIPPERRTDVDVLTGKQQIHEFPPFWGGGGNGFAWMMHIMQALNNERGRRA